MPLLPQAEQGDHHRSEMAPASQADTWAGQADGQPGQCVTGRLLTAKREPGPATGLGLLQARRTSAVPLMKPGFPLGTPRVAAGIIAQQRLGCLTATLTTADSTADGSQATSVAAPRQPGTGHSSGPAHIAGFVDQHRGASAILGRSWRGHPARQTF